MLSSGIKSLNSSFGSILVRSFAQTAKILNSEKTDSSNHSILANLRKDAKELAKEFSALGLKKFFEHWSDRIYEDGMKITDPVEFQKYTSAISEDINELLNQVENWADREIIHLIPKQRGHYNRY